MMQRYSLRNVTLVLCLAIGQVFFSQAQNQLDEGRTTATKIADLLNRFPAADAQALDNAMSQMEDLGQNGITQLALMLEPGTSNEQLEYALAGFAFYASHPSRENLARMAVQAYGKALDKLEDPEAKNFLLTQLKWIGKEDAVPYVEAYLQDDRLSGTAARVLANIGSESAERALILALGATEDDDKKTSYIEALGNFKSPESVEEITPYAASADPELKKVALLPSPTKQIQQVQKHSMPLRKWPILPMIQAMHPVCTCDTLLTWKIMGRPKKPLNWLRKSIKKRKLPISIIPKLLPLG